jgi:ribose-phosphate pyrophosphokinase
MPGYTKTNDYGAFKKTRDFATGEIKITAEDFDFKGRSVVLVDDMVSTGGTTIKASKYALEMGAKEIYLTFVHPVLVGDALENLKKLSPRAIISTDTLESPVSVATIVPDLVKNLKGL